MKRLLLFLWFTVVATGVHAGDLKPFTSDGCSAFPEGTINQGILWLSCCTEHDKAYWAGGTKLERKRADAALKQCVIKVGEPDIAQLMLAGVRVGGTPYFPTNFRWGYGWPYYRGYKMPTAEEQAEIEAALKHSPAAEPESLVSPGIGNLQ